MFTTCQHRVVQSGHTVSNTRKHARLHVKHRHMVRVSLTEFIAPCSTHRGVLVAVSTKTSPLDTSCKDQSPRPELDTGLKSGESAMSMMTIGVVRVFMVFPVLFPSSAINNCCAKTKTAQDVGVAMTCRLFVSCAVVPLAGLEPAYSHERRFLGKACIPIPPQGQKNENTGYHCVLSAGHRSRTCTPFRAPEPKSGVSAISPHRLVLLSCGNIISRTQCFVNKSAL